MELLTSIIDLDSIQVKRSLFSPVQKSVEIEALANTVIDLGGLINIPVVQQVSIDEYELISGHLEFYAYCKAREIDPRLPDRMTVFVANKKNQAEIRQQLEVLQSIDTTWLNSSQPTTSRLSEKDLQLRNLEASLKNANQTFLTLITQFRVELFEAIAANSPQSIAPLDMFNRILEPEIAFQVQRIMEESVGASKAKKAVVRLRELCQHENHRPFQSFAEILNLLKEQQKNRLVRLISEEKMLAIIDSFQSETVNRSSTNQQTKNSRFSSESNEILTVVTQFKTEAVSAIRTQFPKPTHPLEAFNRIKEPEISEQVQRKLEFLGIRKAEKIVQQLQIENQHKNHRPLQSFSNVLKVLNVKQGDKSTRLISEGKMIAILDRWKY